MKRATVNLLPTTNRFETSRIRLSKQLKKAALITVIVWIFFVSVTFAFKIFFVNRKKKVLAKKTELEVGLEQLAEQTSLQQALRLRIKKVATMLEERDPFSERFNRAMDLFPEGTILESVNISLSTIEFNGRVSSLAALKEFEESILSAKESDLYRKADIKSLTKSNQDQSWSFFLELEENVEKSK